MVEGRVTMAGAVHADLVDRLGRDRVAMGEAARRMAGFDPQGREGPVAVVRPSNAEQVEHVLRIGRLRHLPVEVRSRLPALLPDDLRDTLTLDTSGLNRPPAIDIGRRVVTVGAGVEAAAVDRATRQARLDRKSVV
jgi:FAD/FMN-containing dehydrogenase